MLGTETPPAIAVVVPTHNRRPLIERAVASVLSQSYGDFELFIVDDCSDDDTGAYLASLRDRRVRWQRLSKRRGANFARNIGVAQTSAPIVSFLDSDDVYLQGRLAATLSFFLNHPDVHVRISSYQAVNLKNRIAHLKNPDLILAPADFERLIVMHCLFIGGSGIAVTRSAFELVGGFDPELERMQDRDFLLRLSQDLGAGCVSAIDWLKYASRDSISGRRKGQIDALARLAQKNPILSKEYDQAFQYLVAREVLTPIVQGRFWQSFASYRASRRHQETKLRLRDLVPAYVKGRKARDRLRAGIDTTTTARTETAQLKTPRRPALPAL